MGGEWDNSHPYIQHIKLTVAASRLIYPGQHTSQLGIQTPQTSYHTHQEITVRKPIGYRCLKYEVSIMERIWSPVIVWLMFSADTRGLLHHVDSHVVKAPLMMWCYQMEILSVLLAICAGNSPVTCSLKCAYHEQSIIPFTNSAAIAYSSLQRWTALFPDNTIPYRTIAAYLMALTTKNLWSVWLRKLTKSYPDHPWAPSHHMLHPRAGWSPFPPSQLVAWLAAAWLILF